MHVSARSAREADSLRPSAASQRRRSGFSSPFSSSPSFLPALSLPRDSPLGECCSSRDESESRVSSCKARPLFPLLPRRAAAPLCGIHLWPPLYVCLSTCALFLSAEWPPRCSHGRSFAFRLFISSSLSLPFLFLFPSFSPPSLSFLLLLLPFFLFS